MPKTVVRTKDAPKHLKPYIFHGVNLGDLEQPEVVGTCPFCGRDGKFYVDSSNGVWSCKVCQTGTRKGGGNAYTFIRELHELSRCLAPDAAKLAKSRKLLQASTLEKWGVRISATSGEWIVPAWNGEKRLTQLYKYARSDGKMLLLGTPELHNGVYGVNLYEPSKSEVWVFEGPWDAMAAWEVIAQVKPDGTPTANPDFSILADVNVLAIPGAGVFQESWMPLFQGKKVTILFDSDHPKENNGRQLGSAGFNGARRTAGMIARPDGTGASEVRYLQWGMDGYDPSKPSGYDVRDHLTEAADLRGRAAKLKELLAMVRPMPPEWVGPGASKGSGQIELEECSEWDAVCSAWCEAARFTEDHKYVLASMLATAVTTRVPGAQVWLQVQSPPSTFKTTLAEGLGVNKKWTHSVDKFSGFFSGFTDGTDKDFSPILKMKDKTLIIKEAASLLADGNRGDLMADLVSAWDRKSNREWKTGKNAGAEAINMTVLLLGTSTMRQMDMSETGARFLTCTLMNEITEELENDILERASFSAIRNMTFETNGTQESHHAPELIQAWRVTGGYLDYLRTNANELCSKVHGNFPEKYRRLCCDYAKFVAYLRARPSKVQDETADRELAARLVEQITKLAIGYAVVTQRPGVDAYCMRWVRRIALDSAHGKSLTFVNQMRKSAADAPKGLMLDTFNRLVNETERTVAAYRTFLCRIGVCEVKSEPTSAYSARTIDRILLTERMTKLYDSVMKEI